MHRYTVTRSWGPLLCHSSTTITSCCSMIMHGPMLQGSVHNSWKLKTSQFLHSQHTYRTCHPLSMFGMLWIGVYDSVFQFLPISSNFTQPLKRSGPICHRPQSTTWSTPKSRMIIVKSIHFILQHKSLYIDPWTRSSQKLLAWLCQTSYFRSISVRFYTQSDIANQLPDYLRLRTSRPTNEQRAGWEPWRRC